MKQVKWVIITMGLMLATLIALPGTPGIVDASAADGAALYKAKCASCHGADGKGETAAGKAMKVRDLCSTEVQAQSDAELTEITGKGKGKMPGYEKSIGADGVKAVVAYIRTLKH
ncbi:MAG: cytochrome c [Acidobacteriota bacterium]